MMKALMIGAAALALSAGTASAATTLSWDETDLNVGYTLDFNGFTDDGEIDGLTAQIKYTLTNVSAAGVWTFGYEISNTSEAPITASRISSFGFDVDQALLGASSTGAYKFASTPSSSIPNGIGVVDACFRTVSNGNCNGGNGGITYGAFASGNLLLNIGAAPTQIDLSNFYVRYQSVAPGAAKSASGVPVSAVPEPGVWALMIAGFGLMGSALRASRRKSAAVAA